MSEQTPRDPRDVLAREKYFTLRPQPLEHWLWSQGIPHSAERVFWLHWQEGMRNQDWSSAIPVKQVARQCRLDVSTVTRSYQVLIGRGLIRRQDPGRDPDKPFQQAVAITEIRVPRELLVDLDRYPNRPQVVSANPPPESPTLPPPVAIQPSLTPAPIRPDPFAGLTMKHRLRALGELRARMSPAESRAFDEASRLHTSGMTFDENSQLSAEQRATVLVFLQICAVKPTVRAAASTTPAPGPAAGPRKLSVFELAQLRRQLAAIVGPPELAERLREVVWSIEEGALRRFQTLHAMRIALKKVREGAWTRPNRMPPNWARALTTVRSRGPRGNAQPEICRSA